MKNASLIIFAYTIPDACCSPAGTFGSLTCTGTCSTGCGKAPGGGAFIPGA